MIESKELVPLKAQLSKLENQATAVVITTPEENEEAKELKARLKELGKMITERKEAITKPLNEALRSARELFAPLEKQFDAAENIVGKKLLAYKAEVEAKAREAEAKIAARVEKGTMKLETAEKKIEQLPTVQKTTQTTYGQVQFRRIKKVRLTNRELVPDQYLVVDMVAVRRDALAGVQIPGVEVYEEETV